jgi:hypothetical protein
MRPPPQQILQSPAPDEVLAAVAGPFEERRVDLDDETVGQRRQVAARRVVVEILGAVLEQAAFDRRAEGVVRRGPHP